MSWPKRIFATLFVLTIVAIVVLSLRPREEPPVSVQVDTVKRGPISRSVIAAGKLQAATQIKVSSNLSGDLLELTVEEGDQVKKGQLLARIDSRRYAAQVRQQEAVHASAEADLELEKVQVARLEAELARVRRLVAASSASEAELERAEADLAAERARARAVEERIEQTDAMLAEARHFLSLTTLYAPIDGIVTSRQKTVGERVRGSDFSEDVIVIIATLSSMEVKVEVGEHEVVYLHEGDHAEVEVDAIPDKKWPASVVEIARNANIKNAGTEAEVTTFYVRLALLTAVPNALPGMSAQATIITDTHDDAIKVPIQAVAARPQKDPEGMGKGKGKGALSPGNRGGGGAGGGAGGAEGAAASRHRSTMQKVVYVVESESGMDVAKERPVQVGLANESEIEITAGLKDGDRIVVGPYRVLARELADGERLMIEKPEQADDGKAKDEEAVKPEEMDKEQLENKDGAKNEPVAKAEDGPSGSQPPPKADTAQKPEPAADKPAAQ